MDFKREITKDQSVINAKRLANYIIANKYELKNVTKTIFDDDTNISMRSAWILSHVSMKSPEIIVPLIPQFLNYIRKKDAHPGTVRCILSCIQRINIPGKYCSEIFDYCMDATKNAGMPNAVRAFSITILGNICKNYPELKPEVEMVLNELKTFPQPGSIIVRMRDTFKILSKL
jgi:hypothetical protein